MTSNSVKRVGLSAAAVLAVAASLAACAAEQGSLETSPSASSGTDVVGMGACTHVDAPMLDIPAASDTEPQLRIPVPPGWARNTELDSVDQSLRFTLAHTVDDTGEPPQNVAIVSLDRAEPDSDAQAILDDLRSGLKDMLEAKQLPTDFATTPGTVCGLPAQALVFAGTATRLGGMTLPQGRPATALHVVAEAGGHTYLIQLTTTTEPDDPKYQRDVETILTGFQVLPPASAT